MYFLRKPHVLSVCFVSVLRKHRLHPKLHPSETCSLFTSLDWRATTVPPPFLLLPRTSGSLAKCEIKRRPRRRAAPVISADTMRRMTTLYRPLTSGCVWFHRYKGVIVLFKKRKATGAASRRHVGPYLCMCARLFPRPSTYVADRSRVTPGAPFFLFLIDLDRAAAEMKGTLGTHPTL